MDGRHPLEIEFHANVRLTDGDGINAHGKAWKPKTHPATKASVVGGHAFLELPDGTVVQAAWKSILWSARKAQAALRELPPEDATPPPPSKKPAGTKPRGRRTAKKKPATPKKS